MEQEEEEEEEGRRMGLGEKITMSTSTTVPFVSQQTRELLRGDRAERKLWQV